MCSQIFFQNFSKMISIAVDRRSDNDIITSVNRTSRMTNTNAGDSAKGMKMNSAQRQAAAKQLLESGVYSQMTEAERYAALCAARADKADAIEADDDDAIDDAIVRMLAIDMESHRQHPDRIKEAASAAARAQLQRVAAMHGEPEMAE